MAEPGDNVDGPAEAVGGAPDSARRHPYNRDAFKDFDMLSQQFDKVKQDKRRYKGRAVKVVNEFNSKFRAEYELFVAVLFQFTDPYPCANLDDAAWLIAEEGIFHQLGSSYERHFRCLQELRNIVTEIAHYLGLTLSEEDPGLISILESNEQWKRFILALGTTTGSMGGDLQLLLFRLQEEVDSLRKIQEGLRSLRASDIEQLNGLRTHVNALAQVLGDDGGCVCTKCQFPQEAYIRVKGGFYPGEETISPSKFRDEMCSLVIRQTDSASGKAGGHWMSLQSESNTIIRRPPTPSLLGLLWFKLLEFSARLVGSLILCLSGIRNVTWVSEEEMRKLKGERFPE